MTTFENIRTRKNLQKPDNFIIKKISEGKSEGGV